jgi:hypothetical protein
MSLLPMDMTFETTPNATVGKTMLNLVNMFTWKGNFPNPKAFISSPNKYFFLG